MKPGSASFRMMLLIVAAGLLGCSLIQGLIPSGEPPVQDSPALAETGTGEVPDVTPQPASPTTAPSATWTATLVPSPTILPSVTMAPTWTRLPTTGPLPTIALPTARVLTTPTFNPKGTNYPYTLRVFNRGRHEYWIGTHPPYLGNCIKPDAYIEFYLTEAQAIRVYWCQINCSAKLPERLLSCQNRMVSVAETQTVVEVP